MARKPQNLRNPRNPGESSKKTPSHDLALSEVLTELRTLAPEALAESWDKVGLHLGSQSQRIRAGLLCIDLTEAVVAEAVKKKCELIVAYHPPIFAPLERLTDEGPWTQRRILAAARAGLAVYSPHTALDAVRGGVNDWLCEGLGKANVRFSIGQHVVPNSLRKIAVYVPRKDAECVRQAMSDAGAGGIGRYSECSFNVDGIGTFRGGEGSKPAIGKPGRLEHVEETRIEMICQRCSIGDVVRAVREAHPYEEPAIDVLRLDDFFEPEDAEQGAGRVHHLNEAVAPMQLIQRLKRRLGIKRLGLGDPIVYQPTHSDVPGMVQSIAVCVGSGGKLFETYPFADAYLTGEMSHHQTLDLVQRGKVVILAGHTETERPYLPVYRDRIRQTAAGGLRWEVSSADVSPLAWA